MIKRALLMATLVVLSSQAFAADATGEWLVADQTARIGISPCGEALCGKITWTLTPGGVDENNPDPQKRARPVLGMEILQSMKATAPNRWEGSVYNAQNGKTYKAVMSLDNPDVLRMEGCVLGGLICGGQSWTRVKDATGSVKPVRAKPSRQGS